MALTIKSKAGGREQEFPISLSIRAEEILKSVSFPGMVVTYPDYDETGFLRVMVDGKFVPWDIAPVADVVMAPYIVLKNIGKEGDLPQHIIGALASLLQKMAKRAVILGYKMEHAEAVQRAFLQKPISENMSVDVNDQTVVAYLKVG